MKILAHSDADGQVAAHFTNIVELNDGVVFPEIFGDYSEDPEGIMVDMRPVDESYSGLCLDHHPNHPEERDYELIHDDIPAGAVTLEHFKDDIPESEEWKVAIAYMGDVQEDKIPTEIFRKNPILLKSYINPRKKYGNVKGKSVPIYKKLSSPLNAANRVGSPEVGFEILSNAETPFDILNSEQLNAFKGQVRKATKNAYRDSQVLDLDKVLFIEYEDKINVNGILGAELYDAFMKTVVVLNTDGRNFSIRGVLSDWLVEELKEYENIEVGGHEGAAGGYLEEPIDLKPILTKLVDEFKIETDSDWMIE